MPIHMLQSAKPQSRAGSLQTQAGIARVQREFEGCLVEKNVKGAVACLENGRKHLPEESIRHLSMVLVCFCRLVSLPYLEYFEETGKPLRQALVGEMFRAAKTPDSHPGVLESVFSSMEEIDSDSSKYAQLRLALDECLRNEAAFPILVGSMKENGFPFRIISPIASSQAFRALIFDFDGVIVDTETLRWKSFLPLFQSRGICISEQQWRREFSGRHSREIIAQVIGGGNREKLEQFEHDRKARYLELCRHGKISPIPGAIEFIQKIRDAGLEVAIASSGDSRWIYDILKKLNFEDLFRVIVGHDTVKARKPNPAVYLNAASALGLDKSLCLGVEDSSTGIEALTLANMKLIVINPDKITTVHPIVPDFFEALNRLR
ncbi:MAG: HAD family phosphatase [Candidatus Micrarchaeota archaeon]|nr:HAD family phosphatase [Candidatus Micrarchaeota archaeon]